MSHNGSIAKHAIITDECRKNRTDDGAFYDAMSRLRIEYKELMKGWPQGSGAKFHLLLTVERPKEHPAKPHLPALPEDPSSLP